MAPTLIDPGISTFYDRTLGFQSSRGSPFSIWGQDHSLETVQTAVKLGVIALAGFVAFFPKRRTLAQSAALAAAVIVAAQITVEHWFYLYIPWFFPLALVALTAGPRRNGPRGADVEVTKPGGHQNLLYRVRQPRWLISTTAPITQTSSSAVSKRTGIWVTKRSSACSRRTPITPAREPVMPTSVM